MLAKYLTEQNKITFIQKYFYYKKVTVPGQISGNIIADETKTKDLLKECGVTGTIKYFLISVDKRMTEIAASKAHGSSRTSA